MIIRITFKNGRWMEFPNCSKKDFEILSKNLCGFGKSFIWEDRTWIKKDEIVMAELEDEEQYDEGFLE